MRRVAMVVVVAALCGGGAAAESDPGWTAPAWYQLTETRTGGQYISGGPYASEEECERLLPPADEEGHYRCRYISQRPYWPD
jgi:hypothetical protein